MMRTFGPSRARCAVSLGISSKAMVLAALTLSFVACSKKAAAPPQASVANVAGQSISQAMFDYYIAQQTGTPANQVNETLKASLLQDLKALMAAAAIADKTASSETREALELQRIETLARAGAKAAGVFAQPSDADLQAEYQRYVASQPAMEFHVAHILVATEGAARGLIVRLQGGMNFAKAALEQSADDSKVRGGDLGWIAPGKLPVEFTDAVKMLKPGQITLQPVHTIYGWHVVKLLETRAATAPPFEQVKAQLAENLQQAHYRSFLKLALANAM